MTLSRDTSASTSVVAFLVAGAIFLAAIAAVFVARPDPASGAADDARQRLAAEGLADILVGSAGVGWEAGPDHVRRLGLANANGSGLDPATILALKGALASSAANGKVDYEEAQRSLGLDPAGPRDFHVRVYPVGMSSVYDASLSGIRVAYIADFASLASVTLPLGTPPSLYAAQANAQLNLSMAPSTALERQALRDLGLGFSDRVFITSAQPGVLLDQAFPLPDLPALPLLGLASLDGDVYPDVKAYLDAVLPSRLAGYDMLVVGSGAQHSSLTSNGVKDGIRDWVLAGGMLVVLGSNDQAYQWLQPLFSTGVATVNGAALAPDVSHPLLKEPNALDWPSYATHGRGWDIKDRGSGAHYDDFSHVIVQDGEDVLAISKDGAFGAGRILLTTYLPREIASTLGLGEAMGFLENIVLFGDRSNLYLEYGPSVAADQPVAVAVRQSWLHDEKLGQVPVRIEVHAWG